MKKRKRIPNLLRVTPGVLGSISKTDRAIARSVDQWKEAAPEELLDTVFVDWRVQDIASVEMAISGILIGSGYPSLVRAVVSLGLWNSTGREIIAALVDIAAKEGDGQ